MQALLICRNASLALRSVHFVREVQTSVPGAPLPLGRPGLPPTTPARRAPPGVHHAACAGCGLPHVRRGAGAHELRRPHAPPARAESRDARGRAGAAAASRAQPRQRPASASRLAHAWPARAAVSVGTPPAPAKQAAVL